MHIPLMLISIATLFFPITTSTPIKSARDVTVFNADNAYQISDLTIFVPPANSTVNRTITFTVEDPNPGMALKTVCSKSTNGPLENDMFTRCENDFFHFSLRLDGTIWLYRFIRDASLGTPPWFDYTGCYGKTPLTLHDKILKNGTTRTQRCLDVFCEIMAG